MPWNKVAPHYAVFLFPLSLRDTPNINLNLSISWHSLFQLEILDFLNQIYIQLFWAVASPALHRCTDLSLLFAFLFGTFVSLLLALQPLWHSFCPVLWIIPFRSVVLFIYKTLSSLCIHCNCTKGYLTIYKIHQVTYIKHIYSLSGNT